MVDFGALPPEINSARMYAGPGSSSLQAAASAWNSLSAELQSAAQGYETVITQLSSDQWMGPASAQMASAAQPYVTWMQETAAQAEQAATQARAAAAAYEQAFAATVPPPLIAANRAETAAATQANVFGQYTPLIAQLEAQYSQMWAQDAAAMYGYAGQSSSAAKVTPFASPAASTTPNGTANQAAAVTQAAGTSAADSSQDILQQLLSLLPSNIQAWFTPGGFQSSFGSLQSLESTLYGFFFGSSVLPTNLQALVNAYSPYAGFSTTPRVCPTSALVWATSACRWPRPWVCWVAPRLPPPRPRRQAVSAGWAACSAGAVPPLPRRAVSRPASAAAHRSASSRCPRPGSVAPRWRLRTPHWQSAASARPRRLGAATCWAACRWPAPAPAAWVGPRARATGSSPR